MAFSFTDPGCQAVCPSMWSTPLWNDDRGWHCLDISTGQIVTPTRCANNSDPIRQVASAIAAVVRSVVPGARPSTAPAPAAIATGGGFSRVLGSAAPILIVVGVVGVGFVGLRALKKRRGRRRGRR